LEMITSNKWSIQTDSPDNSKENSMNVITISGYLPDTAKNHKDKSAIELSQLVNDMAAAQGGEVANFDVAKGKALFFVVGDAARQGIINAFQSLSGVVVEETPAINYLMAKNQERQKKADRLRNARRKLSVKTN
jgi:hypothetical protein